MVLKLVHAPETFYKPLFHQDGADSCARCGAKPCNKNRSDTGYEAVVAFFSLLSPYLFCKLSVFNFMLLFFGLLITIFLLQTLTQQLASQTVVVRKT